MKQHQNLDQKQRMGINKEMVNREINEVKPIQNRNKNPQSFQGTSHVQKVRLLHALLRNACEQQNIFEIKEYNSSKKNC